VVLCGSGEVAGVQVEGEDKWPTLIQNANHRVAIWILGKRCNAKLPTQRAFGKNRSHHTFIFNRVKHNRPYTSISCVQPPARFRRPAYCLQGSESTRHSRLMDESARQGDGAD